MIKRFNFGLGLGLLKCTSSTRHRAAVNIKENHHASVLVTCVPKPKTGSILNRGMGSLSFCLADCSPMRISRGYSNSMNKGFHQHSSSSSSSKIHNTSCFKNNHQMARSTSLVLHTRQYAAMPEFKMQQRKLAPPFKLRVGEQKCLKRSFLVMLATLLIFDQYIAMSAFALINLHYIIFASLKPPHHIPTQNIVLKTGDMDMRKLINCFKSRLNMTDIAQELLTKDSKFVKEFGDKVHVIIRHFTITVLDDDQYSKMDFEVSSVKYGTFTYGSMDYSLKNKEVYCLLVGQAGGKGMREVSVNNGHSGKNGQHNTHNVQDAEFRDVDDKKE